MQPKPDKVIRDVVHGYIPLTEQDLAIIDTPHFQRLRHIKQTGAYTVYPSVNHTRFEHSLGVMHLGISVLNSLGFAEDKKLYNTIKYACLLHDIGHAPFSHIGEYFYDSDELIYKLKESLEHKGIESCISGKKAASHELCSCVLALDKYLDKLTEYEVDLDLFCRMILGEQYGGTEKKIEDCLIQILNSPADVDKLDYILRDAFMSGGQFIALDKDRIITAYSINDNSLTFSGKALSTISNLIYGRHTLYLWIYNHHITVYTDSIYKRLINHILTKTNRWGSLFSYHAIVNNLIDDHDLFSFIRANKELDAYSEDLFKQLFERAYFRALWKTELDFKEVIFDAMRQDEFNKLVGEYRNQELGLEALEDRIVKATDNRIKKEDFLIAVADFKPYDPISGKKIYILRKNVRKRFEDIFQSSIYKNNQEILPYVYFRDEKTRDELIDVLNNKAY